ncbi:MAG: hypothetical protein ACU843_10290 [Gammaproteobacteria bacterium]
MRFYSYSFENNNNVVSLRFLKKLAQWITFTAGTVVFSGCAGPKVQMTVLQPPTVTEAVKLKRIAFGEFQGRPDETSQFAQDLENLLTSVRIQGKPYFEIISLRETLSALQNHRRSSQDLTNPDVAKSVGSYLKADGIFIGTIRSGFQDTPYLENRSRCVQQRTTYNKKGEATGTVCVGWQNYTVNCVKRDAGFEFAPRLMDTVTGQSLYSETVKSFANDKACSDSGRSVQSGANLIANARNDALTKIRTALAPAEVSVAAEIMESDSSMFDKLFGDGAGSMQSKDSAEKFESGYQYVKAGRMDRACEIWKDLESTEKNYVPLLYNIGLCEESAGNDEMAQDYFSRADKLSTKPDERITAAMTRIEKQIGSRQMLTKARPDIFYRSAQSRTVEQDQKLYQYGDPRDTLVKIRRSSAYPETVKNGGTLLIVMDYSVMAPKGTADVNVLESLVLKKDGRTQATLREESIKRPPGGRISEVEFKIPAGMPKGTYAIEQKVKAGTSFDTRSSTFEVSS